MKKRVSIIVLLCFCSLLIHTQEVSGFWKGTLTMSGGCFPVNNIELQIQVGNNNVSGNSYHYLDINNYVKKTFKGSYDPARKKVFLEETVVTTYNIPSNCQVCIKNYELVYGKNENVETLTGEWNGKIMGSGLPCIPGTIVLSRIQESAFKEIPEVIVDTGEIRLDFYDNGVIDGDSISVMVNKKLILSHQLLTAKPITVYVKIDLQQTFQEVEMIAENQGSIPPNTALLIVTAGKKRYQLFLTSTAYKSAKVRFVYDKKE